MYMVKVAKKAPTEQGAGGGRKKTGLDGSGPENMAATHSSCVRVRASKINNMHRYANPNMITKNAAIVSRSCQPRSLTFSIVQSWKVVGSCENSQSLAVEPLGR